MSEIDRFLKGVRTAAITGHINPDGDCVGSCLGMKNYIDDNYPEIAADVYLQKPPDVFDFLKGADEIRTSVDKDKRYDLLILLDIGGADRVMEGNALAEICERTLCIDHHKTNDSAFDIFINEPEKSSACEALYDLIDPEKISFDCAQALFTGIVHDTGVFRYTCTSPATMNVVSDLMSRGIPFSEIIEDSFFEKTYAQKLIMGHVVTSSELLFDGRVVLGSLPAPVRHKMGLSTKDLDGIVSQLRDVRGVEIAAFMYELDGGGKFKISLRSRKVVDVSALCKRFGGGGHARAAGCNIKGNEEEVKMRLKAELEKELSAQGLI